MAKNVAELPPGHWQHMSVHKAGGWTGQYSRMLRWSVRARAALSAETLGESGLDDVVAFFQNCYYLRDWLRPSVEPQKLEALFSNKEMRICRDICNGTKHLQLHSPSVDAHFAIGREEVPYFSNGKLDPRERWFVIAAGEKFNLSDLMSACLHLWRTFLTDNALLSEEAE